MFIILNFRQPNSSAMEGSEGLREEPSEQGEPGTSGVPGLGSRVHPGQGISNSGLDSQG